MRHCMARALLALGAASFAFTSCAASPDRDGSVSFDAPLAVVGIMTAPAGLTAARRRDAVWEAWADLGVNYPSLIGQIKCVFVVGRANTTVGGAPPVASSSGVTGIDDLHFTAVGALDGMGKHAVPLLTVPVIDAYNRVVDKVLHLARWAVAATNARFVCKADDDTFVRLPLLAEALRGAANQALAKQEAARTVLSASPGFVASRGGADPSGVTGGGVYFGQFCTGAATRVPGHKNFVPAACFPLSSYPPYAHGGLYALDRDLASFIASNAELFARCAAGIQPWLTPSSAIQTRVQIVDAAVRIVTCLIW